MSSNVQEFLTKCKTAMSLIRGKVRTIRQLDRPCPLELVPNSVCRILERYQKQEITDIKQLYEAKKKLRQYGLIPKSHYGEGQRKKEVKEKARKWRQKHAGYSAQKYHSSAVAPPPAKAPESGA